jgi:hypothetical protein
MVTVTCFWVTVEKPWKVTLTVYWPIGSGVKLYSPELPLVVDRDALVPSLVTVTVAPLIWAPEVSVTVPRMAPASTCACAGELVRNSNRAATAKLRDARRINSDTGVLLIAFLLIRLGPTASSTAVSIRRGLRPG